MSIENRAAHIKSWRVSARTWVKLARMAKERGDIFEFEKAISHYIFARKETRHII